MKLHSLWVPMLFLLCASGAGQALTPTTSDTGTIEIISAEPQSGQRPSGPWRLQDELTKSGAPDWLRMSGEVQLRYERLMGQFRPGIRLDKDHDALVLRSLLTLGADFGGFALTAEIQDSRAFAADSGTAISTGIVNALELLQANASFRFGDGGANHHELILGRYTFDLGSRRLVARNIFRNTINAFTGILWRWEAEDSTLNAFWNFPVNRRPTDLESLVDDDIQIDKEDSDRQFFGVHYAASVFERHQCEVYGFGFLEEAKGSRDRKLLTLGSRLLLPKQPGSLDYELEAVLQVGESRLASTGRRLDHLAGYVHVALGYTFRDAWNPRIRAAFDFGSGDNDPSDGNNNRFDTLFGVPREYAPTSFYRPFTRENLVSTELRLELEPANDLSLMIAHRIGWLAARKDAWVAAGIQDPSGRSGRLIGNQLELRLRWDILPQTAQLELGGAYMMHGKFQNRAPDAQGRDNVFFYAQMVFKF